MSKTEYICQQCGFAHPKWVGQCQSCGAWNSLVEEVIDQQPATKFVQADISPAQSMNLVDLIRQPQPNQRLMTTMVEFDRVLGGGIVLGEVVLLAGNPGIGKSTLMTQVLLAMITKSDQFWRNNSKIVYLAGEENPEQIYLRIKRIIKSEHLGLAKLGKKSLEKRLSRIQFVSDTRVDRVINYLKTIKPVLVLVDSIQTLTSEGLTAGAGSVGQVRASAEKLIAFAKSTQTPMFLIGHVTKEGRVAGPMTLEHMVDCVLHFSGDKSAELRLLRATKNRFGATDEVGVFQLDEFGFQAVADPSQLFTSHQDVKRAVGAVFSCVVEGTRPLLVEVQALVVPSHLPTPRRVGRGVDSARLQVLSAVLEKYLNLPLGSHDIFVSIVGGYKTVEPALDLAIATAIISSIKARPLGKKVFVGEVGLLGEIRKVKLFNLREKEVKRLGYQQLISFKTHHHIREIANLSLTV